jgi:hypothetical protein
MYAGGADMLCPLFNSRFVPKAAGAKGPVRQPRPRAPGQSCSVDMN